MPTQKEAVSASTPIHLAMFGSAFRVSYSLKKHSSDNNSFVHSFFLGACTCLCTCNLMWGPYKVSTRSRPHVIVWHQIFSQTEDFESTSQFHVKLGRARSRHLPPTAARWNNRSQRPQVVRVFMEEMWRILWFFDRMMIWLWKRVEGIWTHWGKQGCITTQEFWRSLE